MDERLTGLNGVSRAEPRRRPVRWAAVAIFGLLLSFSGLGLVTTQQWKNMNQSDRFLNASLISRATADYSSSRPSAKVAQVGLGVIGDIIRDSQPEPAELPVRLASVDAVLKAPVPTETPVPGISDPGDTPNPPDAEKPDPTQPIIHPSSVPTNPETEPAHTPAPTAAPTIKPTRIPNPQITKEPKPDIIKPPKPDKPDPPKPDKPKPPKPDKPKPPKPPKKK